MSKKILIMAAVAMMAISCNKKTDREPGAQTVSKADNDQAKADIMALEDDYLASYNTRSTAGIVNFYADDARSYMYGKPVAAGKPAILEGIGKDYASLPSGAKLGLDLKEIMVSGDGAQAVEIGGFTLSDSTGAAITGGHYFGYFEKRNGKYVCVREMVTADAPVKPIAQ